MRKSDFTPMRVFILCIVLSVVVVSITAFFYPRVNNFDNTTPTIIYIAGLIAGIGIPFGLMKTKKEITR